MSMTQPMTTLSCWQHAPLLCRSSPVLRSTFSHCAHQRQVFLRNDLRRGRADYFAKGSTNQSITHEATPASIQSIPSQNK
jgi:hypothetical protein